MKKFFSYFLIGVLSFGLFSCEDDDVDVQNLFEGTETIDAKDYTKWVYYSFEKQAVVEITDHANSTEWDIAFHRADFRTNGGESGTGMSEVMDLGMLEFDAVEGIPTGEFTADSKIEIMESAQMPPTYVETTGNKILTGYTEGNPMAGGTTYPGAFTFDRNTFTYNPTNKIFVLRCADGNCYAKLKFTQYRSGVIDFDYAYTTDKAKGFTE